MEFIIFNIPVSFFSVNMIKRVLPKNHQYSFMWQNLSCHIRTHACACTHKHPCLEIFRYDHRITNHLSFRRTRCFLEIKETKKKAQDLVKYCCLLACMRRLILWEMDIAVTFLRLSL